MIRVVLFVLLVFSVEIYAKETPKSMNTWKSGVVTIQNKVIKSPYNAAGQFNGSGFIVDKKLGLALTNKHVVNQSNINETFVTLSNGRELEANVIYSDPLHDFSFLKIKDTAALENAHEFKLSPSLPKESANVTIIGNNDSQSFSIQKGIITNTFELSNYFPSQSIRISLNAKGGSSGSPIIDGNGEVVAINFAVDTTYSYALNALYLLDALSHIKKGEYPVRRDLGIIYSYISIDSAKRFFSLTNELIDKYRLNSPVSHKQMIIVDSLMADSTALGALEPGDILLKLNGKPIGANLYELQKTIDQNKEVKIEFLRFGKIQSASLKTADLSTHRITKMLEFGGALFYEADDFISLISGAKIKQVFMSSVEQGASFETIPSNIESRFPKMLLNIDAINEHKINSLDGLRDAVKKMKSKQDFIVFYKNYYGRLGYNKSYFSSRMLKYDEIQLSSYENDALLYELDPNTNIWKINKLSE